MKDPLIAPLAAIAAGILAARYIPFPPHEPMAAAASFLLLGVVATWRKALAEEAHARYHDISRDNPEAVMAQLVVRNLETSVKAGLQRRARRHGRSTEEEVREILRSAAHLDDAPAGGLGSEIASLFAKTGLAADIPELRGHEVKPAALEP